MSKPKPYLKETRYVTALCVWVPDAMALIEGCRYDSCYPAHETESAKIERLMSRRAEPADHIIRLIRTSRSDGPPTIGRWRSFSSFVLDVRHPQDTPPDDAALANLVQINVDIHKASR